MLKYVPSNNIKIFRLDKMSRKILKAILIAVIHVFFNKYFLKKLLIKTVLIDFSTIQSRRMHNLDSL